MYYNKVKTKNHRINFKKFRTKKNKHLKGGADTVIIHPEDKILLNNLIKIISIYKKEIKVSSEKGIIGGPQSILVSNTDISDNIDTILLDLKSNFCDFKRKEDCLKNIIPTTINDFKPFLNVTSSEGELNSEINKSELVISSFHGGLHFDIENLTNYKKVPPKTMIFFTTPLGYQLDMVLSKKSGNNNLIDYFDNLSSSEFKKLFLLRSTLSNLDRTIISPANYNHEIIFNCFKNGIWYYPEQKYPDLGLSIYNNDFDSNYIKGDFEFFKLCLDSDSNVIKKQATINNLNGGNDSYKSLNEIKQTMISEPDFNLDSLLSDFIDSNPNDEGGFRLFIIPTCRFLIHDSYIYFKKLLKYELILQNINYKLDYDFYMSNKHIIDSLINDRKIKKLPLCNFHQDEYVLIEYINYDNLRFYEEIDPWVLPEGKYISSLIEKYIEGYDVIKKEALFIVKCDFHLLFIFFTRILELGERGEQIIGKIFNFGETIITNKIKIILDGIENLYTNKNILYLYSSSDEMVSKIYLVTMKILKILITFHKPNEKYTQNAVNVYHKYLTIYNKGNEYGISIYYRGKNKKQNSKPNADKITKVKIDESFYDKYNDDIQKFDNLQTFIVSLYNFNKEDYSIVCSQIKKKPFNRLNTIKLKNVMIDEEIKLEIPSLKRLDLNNCYDDNQSINTIIITSSYPLENLNIFYMEYLDFLFIKCEVENIHLLGFNENCDSFTNFFLEQEVRNLHIEESLLNKIHIQDNIKNITLENMDYNDGLFEFKEGRKYSLSTVEFNYVNFIEPLNKKMFDPKNISILNFKIISEDMIHLINAFNRTKYRGNEEKIIRLKNIQNINIEFIIHHDLDISFINKRLFRVINLIIKGEFIIVNETTSKEYKEIIKRRGIISFTNNYIKINNSRT